MSESENLVSVTSYVRQLLPGEFNWSGKEKELQGLWNDGLSMTEIADSLGVDRGAVSGKIDRLRKKGWAFDSRPRHLLTGAERSKKRNSYKRNKRASNSDRSATQRIKRIMRQTVTVVTNHGNRFDTVERLAPRAFVESPVAANFLGITFAELAWKEGRPSNCRFPREDSPPFSFCGQPVRPGESWCPSCARIVFNAPAPARRFLPGVIGGVLR